MFYVLLVFNKDFLSLNEIRNFKVFLLKLHRSINETDGETGKTPLHIALEEGKLSCVRKLLQLEAKVNLADYKGNIPLHLAARCRSSDILKVNFNCDCGLKITHCCQNIMIVVDLLWIVEIMMFNFAGNCLKLQAPYQQNKPSWRDSTSRSLLGRFPWKCGNIAEVWCQSFPDWIGQATNPLCCYQWKYQVEWNLNNYNIRAAITFILK